MVMVAQAGLAKVHRQDTSKDCPTALTPHAPLFETDAPVRIAMWLASEQRFCLDHKWATSADQEASRWVPR